MKSVNSQECLKTTYLKDRIDNLDKEAKELRALWEYMLAQEVSDVIEELKYRVEELRRPNLFNN